MATNEFARILVCPDTGDTVVAMLDRDGDRPCFAFHHINSHGTVQRATYLTDGTAQGGHMRRQAFAALTYSQALQAIDLYDRRKTITPQQRLI